MDAKFEFLCRMGDSTLILGHRISEWCGKAPVLEEDIALPNIALDLIGQTQMWLAYAAEVEGAGHTADDLAMRRDVWDFRNLLLVERPNGDFAQTMTRQFLFDAWHLPMLQALTTSSDKRIAEIAAKAVKEATYHYEKSSEMVVALGDGTEESHARMQSALDLLWPFAGEAFVSDTVDHEMAATSVAPTPETLWDDYEASVKDILSRATLTLPKARFAHKGGKSGTMHSEHLGHLLTQMQWLQRAYPDARW
ncbi:MAG: phenylacetate-CoA oxygenase subunit PaaC [Pseudoprimorskyibacter sp.]|nr:phenylacetate-CoA oxygenase subunit PaaC [Pseudoprimorskyibacter sp.]